MVNIYILSLVHNKYYVGRTSNPLMRIDMHFEGIGSQWTSLHKPINVYKFYTNCDLYDEDKYTIMMMGMFGIENVRGGSFSQVQLSSRDISFISKMIDNANDKCFICSSSHFIKECPFAFVHDCFLQNILHTIISKCEYHDIDKTTIIDRVSLLNILNETDHIIFNNISTNYISRMCKIINKKNIIGLPKLHYHKINYINFTIGLLHILEAII